MAARRLLLRADSQATPLRQVWLAKTQDGKPRVMCQLLRPFAEALADPPPPEPAYEAASPAVHDADKDVEEGILEQLLIAGW